MSDKWNQLKEIKGLLAALVSVGGVLIVIGGLLMEWRIAVRVDAALAAQDLATDSNIMQINAAVAENKRTGSENAEDIEQNRDRVEAAFAALLGRDEP